MVGEAAMRRGTQKLKVLLPRIVAHLCRLRDDDTGATAVVMALLFPLMVGGMGLGAEVGYWFMIQRKLQHAADTAVYAAGVRKRAGDLEEALKGAALRIATQSGFVPSRGSLTLNTPPEAGTLKDQSKAVELILAETHPRLLSSIFLKEPVSVQARAVANLSGGAPACVLALSRTASPAVSGDGSSTTTLTNCNIATNSTALNSFDMGGGTMTADCVLTVGEAGNIGGLTTVCPSKVEERVPETADPYAAVEDPVLTAPCQGRPKPVPVPPAMLPPGCYTDLSNLKDVTFQPGGTYYIKGGVLSDGGNGSIQGEGVTFVLLDGATAKFTGNAMIALSAPTSGPLAGILFFGRDAGATNQVSGTTGSVMTGAVYMPNSAITYTGNQTTKNGCLQIIADTVRFTGNSNLTLGSECTGAGTTDALTGQIVKIVE
jgi:hypothetical protein